MRNVRKWQRENAMLLSHLDPLLNRFVQRKVKTRINGHEEEEVFEYCQQLNNSWGVAMLGTAIMKLQTLSTDLKRMADDTPDVDVLTLKLSSKADDCGDLIGELTAIANGLPQSAYRDNLAATLQELRTCYAAGCFIATLFLAAKVLEFCLKIILTNSTVPPDKWKPLGLGKLIGCVRDNCVEVQLLDGLGAIANLINDNRNPAVHATERNPIPSKEQANMVIYAMADVMKRTFGQKTGP
jgi:hypothetical protein